MESAPTPYKKQDRLESREYTPSIESACHFLNISESTHAQLKERVRGVQGHVRIWVHPLYTEQWPKSAENILHGHTLDEVQTKLRSTFLRTTTSVNQNPSSAPLFVYEASSKISSTRLVISNHIGRAPEELEKHGIVFIPTESISSAVDSSLLVRSLENGDMLDRVEAEKLHAYEKALDDYIEAMDRDQAEQIAEFPEFITDPLGPKSPERRDNYVQLLLRQSRDTKAVRAKYREMRDQQRVQEKEFISGLYRSLNVQSALVSGAYLIVGNDFKTREPQLQSCAGGVVNMLRSAGIQTDISNNIWPPKELVREAGFELKQTGRS